MDRYATVLRQLEFIKHAIQHTYDAAHDECLETGKQMPSELYVAALRFLFAHRDNLMAELEMIRGLEVVEQEVEHMVELKVRIDKLQAWLDSQTGEQA